MRYVIFSSVLLSASVLFIQAQEQKADKLAPYYPTPEIVVDKMLQLGGLRAGEKMFDLGSGDGRLVLAAARKYKADATGVDLAGLILDRTLVSRETKIVYCRDANRRGDFPNQ